MRSKRGASRRPGFTLLELMVVTTILGILALMVVPSVMKSRQRAMVAAVKTELRNAGSFISQYEIINGKLPPTIEDLEAAGFKSSRDVKICGYYLYNGGTPDATILIQAIHRGSKTRIDRKFPDGKFEEYEDQVC